MKKIKVAMMAFVLAAAPQLFAQEVYQVSAQNMNIALTGYVQGESGDNLTAERVRVTTKDIVQLLGGSQRAKLLLLTPVDFDGDSWIVVREGGEDFDVTGWFYAESLLVVEKSTVKNDRINGTQYSIDYFAFGDDSTDAGFELQGFTTSNLRSGAFRSAVNGTGWVGTADAVMNGTIATTAGKTESIVFE